MYKEATKQKPNIIQTGKGRHFNCEGIDSIWKDSSITAISDQPFEFSDRSNLKASKYHDLPQTASILFHTLTPYAMQSYMNVAYNSMNIFKIGVVNGRR